MTDEEYAYNKGYRDAMSEAREILRGQVPEATLIKYDKEFQKLKEQIFAERSRRRVQGK